MANSDEGYLSDLIPVRVNIGDTVVSALRENESIDWEFVKAVSYTHLDVYKRQP